MANELLDPPHNTDAERALLGAILLNNESFFSVSDFLRSEHFYNPVHALIFKATAQFINDNKEASPVTLKTYLQADKSMQEAGGIKYLTELVNGVVTIHGAENYGQIILDLWKRRELLWLTKNLQVELQEADLDTTAEMLQEQLETELTKIAESGQNRLSGLQVMSDLTNQTIDHWREEEDKPPGTTTGFATLDKRIGGLYPGDLIILAGATSMGKTALATAISYNAANAYFESDDMHEGDKCVCFFSLEMQKPELVSRIVTGRTKLQAPRNRRGRKLSQHEWERLYDESLDISNLPLWIDDTPGLTLNMIRKRSLRRSRKQPVGLVVVDYLQLVEAEHGSNRNDTRATIIQNITRGLKRLAKELNCPVLALSQLSRAVENREDKRPVLADLRESGSIEQDADVVMFCYREQYYLERGEPKVRPNESTESYDERRFNWRKALEACENKCDVIIGKQRHGPIGSMTLYFDSESAWFDDLSNRNNEDQLV